MRAASRTLESILSRRAAEHLRAFQSEIQSRLPGKVSRIVLFGSRARGDARRDSDYDLAVFVRDLANRREVNHLLVDVAYPHILEGIYIQPFAVPSDFLDADRRAGLAQSIARDGVVL
jgi:predicted nucleotidyltransferase